jgi:hypothetical protein
VAESSCSQPEPNSLGWSLHYSLDVVDATFYAGQWNRLDEFQRLRWRFLVLGRRQTAEPHAQDDHAGVSHMFSPLAHGITLSAITRDEHVSVERRFKTNVLNLRKILVRQTENWLKARVLFLRFSKTRAT